MRSKELAELAGVSVRTLRHYHQIGVLPEPDRAANGYRSYALSHVALLLRIRRLAALGVSLDRMSTFLEEADGEETADLLDGLDRELEARIEHLQQQRDRIARLRADRDRPDLPPGLDAYFAVVGPIGSHDVVDLERDASLVVAQIVGDTHEPEVRRLGEAMARADRDGNLAAVIERFVRLPATAADGDVEAVAGDFIRLVGPDLADFLSGAAGVRLHQTQPDQVPTIDDDPRLNDAQAAALRLVADHLDRSTQS